MKASHGFSRGWGKVSEKTNVRLAFYRRYTAMRSRCNRKTASDYSFYGGRGIKNKFKSFDEFYNSLWESFVVHSRNNGIRNTTLDRTNVNGNYSPDNCQWATRQVQGKNKRVVRILTIDGISDTINGWSVTQKIPRMTTQRRIDKYGWTAKDAVTTPGLGIHWKRGLDKSKYYKLIY